VCEFVWFDSFDFKILLFFFVFFLQYVCEMGINNDYTYIKLSYV